MIKRIALVVAVAMILTSTIFITGKEAFAKELKIGYVDPIRVLNEYSKTRESERVFESKRKVKEADRKKMVDDITKSKDELAILSDKAKAEKQTVLDQKIKTLQDFDRKTREELMSEGNTMLGEIQKDIQKVISDYAKEQGYDLVLNQRVMLYGKEEYDFTLEILRRLNKQ